MEYLLLALLALALPVMWTAAFFIGLNAHSRLRLVDQRLTAFDRRIALVGTSAAAPEVPPAAPEAGEVPPSPVGTGEGPPETAPAAAVEQPPGAADAPSEPTGAGLEPPAPPASVPPAGGPPASGLAAFAPAARAPRPPGPRKSSAGPGFEERLGTRWVVWVGGVALALGAVFLVRYSIEQGLIGPGMRIFLGALFAAGLIAAGEWTRRKEALSGIAGLPQASIPAILTAAGTMAAFATVWAAHGLYQFIGPGAAFVLLGAVALATLAAALLHGPTLAGLGLVGAYVAPLLVSSTQPNFWALYLYLAIVTAANFGLARLRLWRWLAITAVAASAIWILPGLGNALAEPLPHALYAAAVFALAAVMIVSGLLYGPPALPDAVDGVSSAALTAALAAAALVVVAGQHQTPALVTFALLVAATIVVAWQASSASVAVPLAALLAAFVIAEWAVQIRFETLLAPGGPVARDAPGPTYVFVGTHLTVGLGFAALFGLAGFFAQGRSMRAIVPVLWAAGAVIAPVAILIALYYRIAGFERSIPFAALALLLAALFATATELLSRRPSRPGLAVSSALFAVGAIAALALALTMALEKGWLTVALALMAPGIAMIADQRGLRFLRWFAAAVAVLVCARVAWEPRIVSDVGATPIFNWLLWGYGVPAVSFWVAGHILRRRADDLPARMLEAAAILFTVLTLTLQIRHLIHGDIYATGTRLSEYGLQVSAFLGVAIGLEWVRGRSQSIIHNVGAVVMALLALGTALVGLLIDANPLITGTPVGGLFFNDLLLGYGIPAILAIILALVAMETRPMGYRAVAAASSVVMSLLYLTFEVRRFFQGPVLHERLGASDAELWTYSAVWLAFGVVLLIVGIFIRSQPARLASAVVILLTVLKVFLYDLAGIGGIWRALSFIGLGVVLMAIGWLYQRLLFPPRPPSGDPAAEDEPDTPPEGDADAAAVSGAAAARP